MRRISLLALASILLVAVPSFGQDRSQISGFVTDQTSAIVPGATVTALHVQTGTVRTTVTDSVGYYVFPTLTPGTYRPYSGAPRVQENRADRSDARRRSKSDGQCHS